MVPRLTKNKLVLNPHGRNHFKFYPHKDSIFPDNEKEQILYVKDIYEDLVNNGEVLYVKSKKGNYSIRCVKLKDKYYIVVSMRNEFGTYNNLIHEHTIESDALTLAKFIAKNIGTTMADYKKQILDAKEMKVDGKIQTSTESNG